MRVWSKLKTLYMTNSLANKLYIKKKLYTFYMLAGRKISEHIDKFNIIVLDLENIEVKFKDEDLALLLLTSLPASYEHFVDTLLYGREELILEDVLAALNLKEIKEGYKAKGDNGKGLYVRGRADRRDSHHSRGKSRSKSQGGRLKCYIFQSEDHLKRNCLKNNRKKSTGYVNKDDQPGSSGSTYDDSKVMMVMSVEALLYWIIESGCAYHITPRIRRDNCVYSLDGHAVAGELNASVEEKDSLAQSGLPKTFWVEATCTAAYLINRSPSTAIAKKTPMDMWSGHPSDYGILKIFGCVAYSHVKHGKLEQRAVKCVLLRYPDGVKGDKREVSSSSSARSGGNRLKKKRKECGDTNYNGLEVAMVFNEGNTKEEKSEIKNKIGKRSVTKAREVARKIGVGLGENNKGISNVYKKQYDVGSECNRFFWFRYDNEGEAANSKCNVNMEQVKEIGIMIGVSWVAAEMEKERVKGRDSIIVEGTKEACRDSNTGRKFTRVSDDGINFSKLDQFLLNDEFNNLWGSLYVIALDRKLFDHCLIMLKDVDLDFGPKPFCVFNVWMDESDLYHVVEEAWKKAANGLNTIVNEVVEKGIFRGAFMGTNNVTVSHLQYADDTFFGVDFRRWQKKMHFLLSSISVVYVLITPLPKDGGDNPTREQVRKRAKWDNDDYVCRVGQLLRIKESLRMQDSDKPKSNNVVGPLVFNMVEHKNSSRLTISPNVEVFFDLPNVDVLDEDDSLFDFKIFDGEEVATSSSDPEIRQLAIKDEFGFVIHLEFDCINLRFGEDRPVISVSSIIVGIIPLYPFFFNHTYGLLFLAMDCPWVDPSGFGWIIGLIPNRNHLMTSSTS
uniref:Retrovirus-related Pol polyprotein from transposon TNT 1-94 n=1 Tax=Tanacetum cinerariifolium TaxID=118510 RepID=A0A6L2LTT0_TANCI|nr:retrovirus-related Pol polyprotein from transposon TNT 1-94 [Tanacetum cinerariifolium]